MEKHDIAYLRNCFDAFAHHFLTIRGRGGGVQPFILNEAQKAIIKTVNKQQKENKQVRLIILKGRQMGVSTLIAALNFYNGWRSLGKRGLIMAHRKDAAKNLMHILQHFHKDLPLDVRPKHISCSAEALQFIRQDSSWQVLTAGACDVGRSETVQFLHASEVAFWPQAAEHLTALFAAVGEGNGSHIILESTANGNMGAFYDLCIGAKKKNAAFELLFLPWYLEPSYRSPVKSKISSAWRLYQKQYGLSDAQLSWAINKNASFIVSYEDKEQKDGPSKRFRQEYPASVDDAFQASNQDGLISYASVDKAIQTRLRTDPDEALILGVDLARGGADESWMISRRGRQLGIEVHEGCRLDDAMQLADWIAFKIEKHKVERAFMDAGMIGAAVYDRLKQLGFSSKVEAVFFGSGASDKQRWFNKRAEMWDKMRFWLSDHLGVQVVGDDVLKKQICTPRFDYSYNDQLKLEAKENIKARLGCSPDRGDAAALTFTAPVYKQKIYYGRSEEYDPLNWSTKL